MKASDFSTLTLSNINLTKHTVIWSPSFLPHSCDMICLNQPLITASSVLVWPYLCPAPYYRLRSVTCISNHLQEGNVCCLILICFLFTHQFGSRYLGRMSSNALLELSRLSFRWDGLSAAGPAGVSRLDLGWTRAISEWNTRRRMRSGDASDSRRSDQTRTGTTWHSA